MSTRKTTNKRMCEKSIQLDEEKHAKLQSIAASRRVSMAVVVREGLDRVLDLAEKQQNTTERYLKNRASRTSE